MIRDETMRNDIGAIFKMNICYIIDDTKTLDTIIALFFGDTNSIR